MGKTKGNDNKTSTNTLSSCHPHNATTHHHIPYALQNGLNSMSLFDCEKTDKNKYFRGVQINFNPKS